MKAPEPRLRVRGLKGFLAGEERLLSVGEELVVGRSRQAGLSVRLSPRFLEREDRPEIQRSTSFQSVSREHARIRYLHRDLVEVQDLSHNGTFLDGRRVDCVAVTDLRERSHVISLGAAERLLLELERANGSG